MLAIFLYVVGTGAIPVKCDIGQENIGLYAHAHPVCFLYLQWSFLCYI